MWPGVAVPSQQPKVCFCRPVRPAQRCTSHPTWSTNTGASTPATAATPDDRRLRVLHDALVVEQGDKRVVGRMVRSTFSYLYLPVPPSFKDTIRREVRSGPAVDFVFFRIKPVPVFVCRPTPRCKSRWAKFCSARDSTVVTTLHCPAPRPAARFTSPRTMPKKSSWQGLPARLHRLPWRAATRYR